MNEHHVASVANRRHRTRWVLLGFLGLAVCSTLLVALDRVRAQGTDGPTLQSGEYVLGPMDKVRLKVFAWRPARDEVYEWKALNDVYTVGASGQLSLPLIGDVPAGGRSLRQLSQAVGEGLREKLGLVEAPSATAEIAEFRPFYIFGAVQRPGEYSYRPGLTIIQALSIAGGLPRLSEVEAMRLDRDAIAAAGDRQVIESEINSLVAKRARLAAEAVNASSISFPPALQSSQGVALEPVLLEEQRIFNAGRASLEAKTAKLERMKEALQQEIQSNEDNLSAQDSYMRVAKQEFKQFDEMWERKLTTINRVAEAARNVMLVNGERLRMESSMARARHDMSRIEMELADLRNNRINQSTAEFRATQAKLDELKRKYATADRLRQHLDWSSAYTLRLVSTEDRTQKNRVNFTITRPTAAGAIELAATEGDVVRPGDTIRVELPLRDDPLPTTTADGGPPRSEPLSSEETSGQWRQTRHQLDTAGTRSTK